MKILKFNESIDDGIKYYKKIDSSVSSTYVKIDELNKSYVKIFTVDGYIKIVKDPSAHSLEKYFTYLPSNVDEFTSAMENAIKSITETI